MPPHADYRHRLALIVLLLFHFANRIHVLLQLPAFVDEGNHLRWAAQIWQGGLVFPFSTAKGLTIYYLAALLPFENPLWPGRAAIALSGVVTLTGIVALARSWGNPRLGLWAAALYSLTPWTFFHERLVIADPLAAAGAVVLIWAATEWARCAGAHCWRRSIGLALLLYVVPLAKLSAAPLLAMPLLVVALRPAHKPGWHWTLRRLLLPYGLAGAALVLTLGIVSLRYPISGEFVERADLSTSTWAPQVLANVRDILEWALPYMGPVGILFLCGALLALWRRSALALLSVAGCALAGGVFMLTAAGAFPRYYMAALPFAALLGAYALGQLDRFSEAGWPGKLAKAVLLTWLFASFARFAFQAYRDPASLSMPDVDRQQYVSDWSSGYGIREATEFTVEQISFDQAPAVVYGQDLATWSIMRLYWPRAANGEPYELWEATAPPVIDVVAARRPAYLLVDTARDAANFSGLNINPHELARFPRPGDAAPVVVYRLAAEPFQFPEP